MMSSVIIDTHILIWDQLDPKRVSKKARKALNIAEENHKIILCEISLWEIAILMKKRRLVIDMSYLDFIDEVFQTKNYQLHGMNPEIAFWGSEIDIETKDPADRIIAATSIVLGLPLISADQFMLKSTDIKTIW
jgi:PIN domain nuclease of toxin-antitoxin system